MKNFQKLLMTMQNQNERPDDVRRCGRVGLRRLTRNQFSVGGVGSNPAGVAFYFSLNFPLNKAKAYFKTIKNDPETVVILR